MKISNYFIILSLLLMFASTIQGYQRQQVVVNNVSQILSPQCSNNGISIDNVCYCLDVFIGSQCNQRIQQYAVINGKYDNFNEFTVQNTLDFLFNLNPNQEYKWDNKFAPLYYLIKPKSEIKDNESRYKLSHYTRMHDLTQDFKIFNKNLTLTLQEIQQGYFADCYLFAGLGALISVDQGSSIIDSFITKNDNPNRIYIARWYLYGKPRLISTDDYAPGAKNKTYLAQQNIFNTFWPQILEKQWIKSRIHSDNIEGGITATIMKAFTGAPNIFINHNQTGLNQVRAALIESRDNLYPLTCQSHAQKASSILLPNHAYSFVNFYNLTLANGTRVELVQLFNPLKNDDQNSLLNEFSDNSKIWTNNLKLQIPKHDFDIKDGIQLITLKDYYNSCYMTTQNLYRKSYQLQYLDIPYVKRLNNQKVSFQVSDRQQIHVYIEYQRIMNRQNSNQLDKQYDRIIDQVSIRNLKTKQVIQLKSIEEQYDFLYEATIENTEVTTYEVNIQLNTNIKFDFTNTNPVNYYSLSVYSKKNSVQFFNTSNPQFFVPKQCQSNCTQISGGLQQCDPVNGLCICNHGWGDPRTRSYNCKEPAPMNMIGRWSKCMSSIASYKGVSSNNRLSDSFLNQFCGALQQLNFNQQVISQDQANSQFPKIGLS